MLLRTEEVIPASGAAAPEIQRLRISGSDLASDEGDAECLGTLGTAIVDGEIGLRIVAVDQQQEVDRSRHVEGRLAFNPDGVRLEPDALMERSEIRRDSSALKEPHGA